MQEFLEDAPCSLLVFFDDGEIAAVNEVLARLLGYPAAELAGRPIDSVLTVASRIFYQTHLFPLLKLHGKAEEIFLTLRSAGGEEIPVLVDAARRNREGVALNQCAMLPFRRRRMYEDEILQAKRVAEEAVRNNEELNRTQAELERHARELDRKVVALQASKQELARVSQVLSHDLREPVRKIAWFTDLLDEGGLAEPGSQSARWLERIRGACYRADGLLHALHEFVALEIADGPVEAVDLEGLIPPGVVEPVELWRACELVVEGEEPPVVPGVRSQLRLLFMRLLESLLTSVAQSDKPRLRITLTTVEQNSYRASPERYRYEPFIRIAFVVNGDLARGAAGDLFDPLENLRRNDTEVGLGLAICAKIVANHHGTISATSSRHGESTVTVLLPLSNARGGA